MNMGHSSSADGSQTSNGGPVKASNGHGGRSSLSMLPLVALIFYSVSGGPFGVEDSVKAGGPLLAILGFSLFPFIWSIPEALVTAELATAFPENGGYVVWISAAFGNFWGFQEGWWKWLSGVIDNALYPVLFLDYLKHAIPIFEGGPTRVVALILITAGLTYLNYRGLNIVGYTAVALTVFSLMPFCIMTVMAVPMIKPERWLVMDLRKTNWRGYLNTLFWNLNYWDSASTLAGEVENPQRTFPKALFYGVLLVVSGYLIPLLAGTGALGGGELWEDGYFADVAMAIGGVGLKWWVEAAAALSNMGLFVAEMSSDSFQLLGMGERGMLPAAFSVRSKYGTPLLGILCSATGVILLSWMSFQEIIEILNFLYCLGMLLEFVALIWLRVKQPHLPRPYRIPLNAVALTLLLLVPSALLVVVMAIASLKTVLFSLGISLVGFVVQPAIEYAKKKNWAEFAVSPELSSLAASEADQLPSHPHSDEPREAESLLEKGQFASERS